jgi:hypothetical protein
MNDTLSPVDLAVSHAAKALTLCRTDDVDNGIALYRKALKTPAGRNLPVGLHLRMLESLGLNDVADIIRRSALVASADMTPTWPRVARVPLRHRARSAEFLLSYCGRDGQRGASTRFHDLFKMTYDELGHKQIPFNNSVFTSLRAGSHRQAPRFDKWKPNNAG